MARKSKHRFKVQSTTKKKEKAVLVALIHRKQNTQKTNEYLDELEFLASTADVQTIQRFTQKLDYPDKKYFVGKGKLEEIKIYVEAHEPDVVIFDDDLSPSQTRNLETQLECKIIDRSILILQIFTLRAKTAQAKTQVELAHYQYMLPRLTRMWTHLSRQKGGIGMRGPGETELETDRRIVRDKISILREKLKKIDRQSNTQRKSRGEMVRVALVGYTNVGKSTLMRVLTKADVFAENKLFATVDATVRKVVWDRTPFLLSDTVGFIRKLPTTLIESFKSTLSEIVEADILLHVVDVSHPSFEEQIEVVVSTLSEIGAGDKPIILVFNKIDNYHHNGAEDKKEDKEAHQETDEDINIETHQIMNEESNSPPTIQELKSMYFGKIPHAVFISATKKENMDELREIVLKEVKKVHHTIYPNYIFS